MGSRLAGENHRVLITLASHPGRSVVKHPKLAEVFGEFQYVETAPQYQAPKKEAKPKAEKKTEDAPKEKAPKAPKEKKPVEKDDDEEEPLVPEEPKAKNPLDDLPKSDFNLGEFGIGVFFFLAVLTTSGVQRTGSECTRMKIATRVWTFSRPSE